MRLSRIFVPDPIVIGETLTLEGERSHYIQSVLRLRRGFSVTVFNGTGADYSTVIRNITRDNVALEILESIEVEKESSLITSLGLGISRGEKMDYAIQKAVELGVHDITPVLSQHSVVRLDDDRKGTRVTHWQKVIISACEQCGRSRLPHLEPPIQFSDWVVQQKGLKLFLDPDGHKNLGSFLPGSEGLCLLSGPEGGFSKEEKKASMDAGFEAVRMGPRVLRAETAVLAALAAAQLLWGDLNASSKPSLGS